MQLHIPSRVLWARHFVCFLALCCCCITAAAPAAVYSPQTGPPSGGTRVTITVTEISAGAISTGQRIICSFGGRAADSGLQLQSTQVASFVCTSPAVPQSGPVNLYISLTGGEQWILAGVFSFRYSAELSTAPAPSPLLTFAPLKAPARGPEFCIVSATFEQPSGAGPTVSARIDGGPLPDNAAPECLFGSGRAPASATQEFSTFLLSCTAPANFTGDTLAIAMQAEGLVFASLPFFSFNYTWVPALSQEDSGSSMELQGCFLEDSKNAMQLAPSPALPQSVDLWNVLSVVNVRRAYPAGSEAEIAVLVRDLAAKQSFALQDIAARVNATLTPAGGEVMPLDLQLDDAKQSLLAAFTPSTGASSGYSISVTVDGRPLEGMPASFQVLDFAVDPADWHVASTSLVDGSLQGTAGEALSVIVTPGPLQLASLLHGQDVLLDVILVQVLGDNVSRTGFAEMLDCVPLPAAPGCSFTINQTTAGTFLLTIEQAGVPVGCAATDTACPNPYQVAIELGPPNISMSFVAAPASLTANAGDTVAFGMYVQDVFGNPGSSTGVQLQLQLPNVQAVIAEIAQVAAGWYWGTSAPLTVAGTYNVVASAGATALPLSCGATAVVQVQPGTPVASKTRLAGSGTLNQTVAGATLLVEAFLQDDFLNSITNATVLRDAQVELVLRGATSGSVAFLLAQDPIRLAASFSLYTASQESISLELGGQEVIQWNITVTAASPQIADTVVEIPEGPAIAGAMGTLYFLLQDAWGNVVNLAQLPDISGTVMSGPALLNTTESIRLAPFVGPTGAYKVQFMATAAGSYEVTLVIGGRQVPAVAAGTGNLTVQVVAGALAPGSSTAAGPALLGGYAGNTLAFTVFPRDAYGNAWRTGPVSIAVSAQLGVAAGAGSAGRDVAVPVTVSSREDGSFIVQYMSSQAGDLTLEVTLNGESISGSPFLGGIRAGPLSPQHTLFSGADLASCVAGTPCSFLVTARDASGNVRLAEVDAIGARGPPGANLAVTASGQGVYKVAYSFPNSTTGMRELSVVVETLTGPVVLGGGPLALSILATAGSVSAAHCTATGGGLSSVSAGDTGTVTVIARDSQGIRLNASGLAFEMTVQAEADLIGSRRLLAPSAVLFKQTLNADGSVGLSYSINRAGSYLVEVFLNTSSSSTLVGTASSDNLAKLPFPASVTVLPAASRAAHSLLSVSATTIVAGSNVSAVVAAHDMYSNTQLPNVKPADHIMAVAEALDLALTVRMEGHLVPGTNTHLVTGPLLVAGAYDLQVELNGGPVGTVSVEVTPGDISPSFSYAAGQALQGGLAGITTSFEIFPKDGYGNAIDARALSCQLIVVGDSLSSDVHQACVSSNNGTALTAALYTTSAALYTVSVDLASLAGDAVEPVRLGPYDVTIAAGSPSAANTSIPALEGTTVKLAAGVPAGPFNIEAYDEFGNAASTDCTGYTVLLLGSSVNASIPVSGGAGGNCSLEFAADSLVMQAPGSWSMLVYLGSYQIQQSPFAIDVLPAPVDPLASYAINQDGQQLQPCPDPSSCPVLLRGVAGELNNFTVTLVDVLGRPFVGNDTLRSTISALQAAGKGTEAEVLDVFSNGDGTLAVQWAADLVTSAGAAVVYQVNVSLAATGEAIFGSPFYGTLQPGPPSLANTTAEPVVCGPEMALVPPLVPQGSPLLQACFLISTFDQFGTAVTTTRTPLNITLAELQPGDSKCVLVVQQLQAPGGEPTGQYIAIVGNVVAGTYSVQASQEGVSIGGPLAVKLAAGALDLHNSVLLFANSAASTKQVPVGANVTSLLVGSDGFGNLLDLQPLLMDFAIDFRFQVNHGPGSNFTAFTDISRIASFFLLPGQILVNGILRSSNQLSITFTPLLSGTVILDANLTFGGLSYRSRGLLLVTPGPVAASSSTVIGPGIAGAVARLPASFYFQAKDSFGNPAVPDCSKISWATSAAVSASSSPAIDISTCQVQYTSGSDGSYSYMLTYDSQEVADIPAADVNIVPSSGPADFSSTLVLPVQPPYVVAGSQAGLHIDLVDSGGIGLSRAEGLVVGGLVQGPSTVLVQAAASTAGAFDASYNLVAAGAYQVALYANQSSIYGPQNVTCVSAATSMSNTSVTILPSAQVQAASPATVAVTPKDAFGNPRDYMNSQWDAVYVTIAGQQFPLPYSDLSFSTVLNISTAGNYSVGIWLESPKLGPRRWLGSYLVTVYAGPPSPVTTEVYGEGVTSAYVGVPAKIYIRFRDQGGNLVTSAAAYISPNLTAQLTPLADDYTLPVDFVYSPPDKALVGSYLPQTPAVHTLYLAVNEVELAGLPPLTVQPGPVVTSMCRLMGLSAAVPVGELAATIEVFDADGNQIHADPQVALSMLLSGPQGINILVTPSSFQWLSTAYQATARVIKAGSYSVNVRRGGQDVAGSPFNLMVLPGATAANASIVSGSGMDASVAGVPANVTVQAADVWGNNRTDSGDHFILQWNLTSAGISAAAAMTPLGSGMYFASYTLENIGSGVASVAVLLKSPQGSVVEVSAADVIVLPAPISPKQCAVQPLLANKWNPAQGSVKFVAGSLAQFVINPRDDFGNVANATTGAAFIMAIGNSSLFTGQRALKAAASTAADVQVASLTPRVDGTILASFTLQASGRFIITAAYLPVLGEPVVFARLPVLVLPAGPDPSASSLASFADEFTAGSAASFVLSLRDSFGNVVTDPAAVNSSTLQLLLSTGQGSPGGPMTIRLAYSVSASPAQGLVVEFLAELAGNLTVRFTLGQSQLLDKAIGSPPVAGIVEAEPASVELLARAAGQVQQDVNQTFYFRLKDGNGNQLQTMPTGIMFLSFDQPTYFGSVTAPVAGLFKATYGPVLVLQSLQAVAGQPPAAAPTVKVSVWHNLSPLASLVANLTQTVGPLDASSCIVQPIFGEVAQQGVGPSILSARAGDSVELLVMTYDSAGTALTTGNASTAALFSAAITPSSGADAAVSSNSDGTYLVRFTATATSTYFVAIRYQQAAVANITITVAAGPVSAADSLLLDYDGAALGASGALELVAGEESGVYVHTNDAFGNPQLAEDGGTDGLLLAYLTPSAGGYPVEAEVVMAADATGLTYRIGLVPSAAGNFYLSVTLDGASVGPSIQYAVQVNPGPFSPPATIITAATVPAVAGQPYSVYLATFDAFGNPYPGQDLVFAIQAQAVSGQAFVTGEVLPEGTSPGTYVGTLTAVGAGEYAVSVILLSQGPKVEGQSGTLVLEYSLAIVAAAVDPTTTLVKGGGLTSATVGQQASFWVYPTDFFGNPGSQTPLISFQKNNAQIVVQPSTASVAVTYIPSVYGQLPLSINYTTEAGSMAVQGNSYTPFVSPAAAPLLTQAQLDTSLASITVGFDQATNQGNMGISQDCGLVLATSTVAKLGDGPTCRFTVPSVLTITLGSQATILPNGTMLPDVVEILPNVISSTAGNAYNASGAAPLQAPADLSNLNPTVVITAPAQVGACEEVVVDACQSFGSGGRPLLFSFLLESTQLQTPELLAQLPRDSVQCSFALSRDALQPGLTYNITVEATNFLHLSGTAQVTMYKAAQVAPTVLIPGGNRTVLQSWEISLQGSASYPSPFTYNATTRTCEPNSPTNRPLDFEWSADIMGPNFEFQALPAPYQATQLSAQLTIPANFLQAGKVYTFLLTATDSGDASVRATAVAVITVQSSPLSVQILGGDNRVASLNRPIGLLALGNDPDNSTDMLGNALPFFYSWTALGPGGLPLPSNVSRALYTDDAQQRGLLQFPPGILSEGAYTFIVEAFREPMNEQRAPATASASVSLVNQTFYQLLVVMQDLASDPASFAPSMPLQLNCQVPDVTPWPLTYQWSVSSFTGADNVSALATTSGNGDTLYVPAGRLTANSKFTFTCQVQSSQGGFQTGQASLTISTADVPTSGSLLVESSRTTGTAAAGEDGMAGLDVFQLIAKDWVGSQGRQLQYEFRYMLAGVSGENGPEQPLALPRLSNSISTTLPAGQVTIILYVRYFDSAATSPLGLPAGARLQSRVLNLQPLIPAQTGGRRLLQEELDGDAQTTNSTADIWTVQAVQILEDSFNKAVANGDVSAALLVASIFAQTFSAESAEGGDLCANDSPSAAARHRILSTMAQLDAVTYSTSTYILQASCAFAGLAGASSDLTLEAAEGVVQFLAAHIGNLQNEAAAAAVAPLPNGDPFKCFATGLSGALTRLGAECNSNDSEASVSAALQALPGLGLAVATTYPVGSTPWGYDLPFFLIQAADDLSQVSAQAGNVSLTAKASEGATPGPASLPGPSPGPAPSQPISIDPFTAAFARSPAATEAGVVVQLLGLAAPSVAEGPLQAASKVVGAYTSSGSAGTLLFTLPEPIPAGAEFQLAQYDPSGGLQAAGRRLLAGEQPRIVSGNQVAVELSNIGGYYYLTGGQAPVITSIQVDATRHKQAVLRTVRVTFAALGGALLLATVAALVLLHRMRMQMKRKATIYPQLGTLSDGDDCEDQSVRQVSLATASEYTSRSDLSQSSSDESECRSGY